MLSNLASLYESKMTAVPTPRATVVPDVTDCAAPAPAWHVKDDDEIHAVLVPDEAPTRTLGLVCSIPRFFPITVTVMDPDVGKLDPINVSALNESKVAVDAIVDGS